jgi:hypothetical protein
MRTEAQTSKSVWIRLNPWLSLVSRQELRGNQVAKLEPKLSPVERARVLPAQTWMKNAQAAPDCWQSGRAKQFWTLCAITTTFSLVLTAIPSLEYPLPSAVIDPMTQGNGSSDKKIYVSLDGLPLTFDLRWPFHQSTSGSDWWVLHGTIRVEGTDGLHAPVAVNLSTTLREVMPSLEPKDAESPVINALRKEADRKQVEFLKSAKLLPVYFSSRHYNFKRNHWVFEKATEEQIAAFVERKVYWQTRAGGGDVWMADAIDAQYLDTTTERLAKVAGGLAKERNWQMARAYVTAGQEFMAQSARFEADLKRALENLEKKHAFERG